MDNDRVLAVAQDKPICELLGHWLENAGYEATTIGNSRLAEQLWRVTRPDIAILDYNLSDTTALDLIPRLRAIDAFAPVILLVGYGSMDDGAHGLELGADLVLAKPVNWPTLQAVIQRCLENERSRRWQRAEEIRRRHDSWNPFLGTSEAIRELADRAHKIADSDGPVLIQGETGCGKGAISHWIHHNSARAAEPILEWQCCGSSVELQAAELFGEEGGNSAPNLQSRSALTHIARKGTIVLQDLGDLDLQLQCRLLRIIEEKPLRGTTELGETKTGARLVLATRHSLARLVRERRLRGDLYFRLSGSPISIPALRERIADVPAISTAILADLAKNLSMGGFGLSEGAVRALQRYSWPGNVRELRNVLEHAVLLKGSAELHKEDLQIGVKIEPDLTANGRMRTLEEVEREYIEYVLRAEDGKVESAAKKLGVPRSSLYHKIKQYGFGRKALRAVQGRPA